MELFTTPCLAACGIGLVMLVIIVIGFNQVEANKLAEREEELELLRRADVRAEAFELEDRVAHRPSDEFGY